jgi:hypothetical protein
VSVSTLLESIELKSFWVQRGWSDSQRDRQMWTLRTDQVKSSSSEEAEKQVERFQAPTIL